MFKSLNIIILLATPTLIFFLLILGYSWFFSSIILIISVYTSIKLMNNRTFRFLYCAYVIGILAFSYFIEIRQFNYYLLQFNSLFTVATLHVTTSIVSILLALKFLRKTSKKLLIQITGTVIISLFLIVIIEFINVIAMTFLLGGIFDTQLCTKKIKDFNAIYVLMSDQNGILDLNSVVFERKELLMFQKIELNNNLKAEEFCEYSAG